MPFGPDMERFTLSPPTWQWFPYLSSVCTRRLVILLATMPLSASPRKTARLVSHAPGKTCKMSGDVAIGMPSTVTAIV